MSVKTIGNINVMKWSGFKKRKSYVFAVPQTAFAKIHLILRGYKKHMVLGGFVYRKELFSTKDLK